MTVSVVGTAAAHGGRRAGMARVWRSGSGTGAGGLVESHELGFPDGRIHGCVEGSTTSGASESNGPEGGGWEGWKPQLIELWRACSMQKAERRGTATNT